MVLGPTDVVMVLGQPAFGARGNRKERCQKFRQVERGGPAVQCAQGRQLNSLRRVLLFHLAVRVKYRVSGRQSAIRWCCWCGHSAEVLEAADFTSL